MFWDKWFKLKEIIEPEIVVWEPILIRTSGVPVKWVKVDGSIGYMICIGVWECEKRYMLTWADDEKIFIKKKDILSIEVDCPLE